MPLLAHHQDVYRSDLAGPESITNPKLYSSRMDHQSAEFQQLDGTVTSTANDSGIPPMRRIHASHEDKPGEDVKIGDHKSNPALQMSPNVLTEHAVGKTTEIQLSLQGDSSLVVC
jgi:hypothetical protein